MTGVGYRNDSGGPRESRDKHTQTRYNLLIMFKPELLNTIKSYNTNTFVSDLIAGVIVGIVALPLAIAFAIASGVNPAAGLFTAIIAGFFISALGGSRVQVGGPTGALQ